METFIILTIVFSLFAVLGVILLRRMGKKVETSIKPVTKKVGNGTYVFASVFIILIATIGITVWITKLYYKPIRKTVPIKAVSTIEPKVITIIAPVGEWSEMIPLSTYIGEFNWSRTVNEGPIYIMYDGKIIKNYDGTWRKNIPEENTTSPAANWFKFQSATNRPVQVKVLLSRR